MSLYSTIGAPFSANGAIHTGRLIEAREYFERWKAAAFAAYSAAGACAALARADDGTGQLSIWLQRLDIGQ